ncbi:hypothetical protein NDU88_001403 [Pleurodeles waltl]|uniref:Uncharacterized protein n=1 Tax=Pleurodeles waltl TaxID=8319 RepID=A0AAV7L9L0_PLEWA|nr:hypothetical protein NDU88_001403 [Pleurodeles waltl]
MEGEYVQAALSLLKKAGRMDLVRQEALPALRPARKAAQGVAAAVMACLPPQAGARPEQKGSPSRPKGWKEGGWGSTKELAPEDLSLPRRVASPSREGEGEALVQRDGEFDPLVPISRKWPTILEWSTTESEGEEPEEVGCGRGGESPSPIARRGAPRCVYGERVPRGSDALPGEGWHFSGARCGSRGIVEARGASGFYTPGVDDIAGTPDLYCPGQRLGRGEPGERRAARPPWHEEQAEPRAAGRSASPGLPVQRCLAADAPEERCGGMGFAPVCAAISWEQRPGPSEVQRFVNTRHTAETKAGEWPQRAQETLGQGGDLWREDEFLLDYEETILEEGELADDGDEDIWWEQGGVGGAR